MSVPALALSSPATTAPAPGVRPRVQGKFLFVGDQKLYVRGVTYGPFRPDADGSPFPSRQAVERDFAAMTANGINALRTYDVPPIWLLDAAGRHGLWVMVGLPWEQHVTFLDDTKLSRAIRERVHAQVRACAGHFAILCYAIGNEIPSGIVRWHGPRRVERFLEQLYQAAKAGDPSALFTYVDYPSTEYLQLSFLDLVCFNVYLESKESFEAYLARLQNIVGERPLLMAEIGLDSRRNGEAVQTRALDWQIRSTFAAGCAGAFVFAWTDEWYRGGNDIEDWDFGITNRSRRAKKALAVVHKAYDEVPFAPDLQWPRISVVVCTYNGSRTLRECLEKLAQLDYPNHEVIIIDDGSTDGGADNAESYGFRLIRTENGGLSRARNVGLEAATGEIVAYIDDDAYPDPDWLRYLAHTFMTSDFVGVGGPNLPPPADELVAQCVAQSPGGPVHVLLSDREAEHIPGCNMAFRKSCLLAIGGFDPLFRAAGDDVDVCWRLMAKGWRLGYSPAAVVWHHRRNSIRAYWKQQKGYGKAEAQLERKWPEKYNAAGHISWAGRIYNNGFTQSLRWGRTHLYQGTWGSAGYQRLDARKPRVWEQLPLTPEWYLITFALAVASGLGAVWKPLVFASPLLALAALLPLFVVVENIRRSHLPSAAAGNRLWLKTRLLTSLLHVLQPLARLRGRLSSGLTPWRPRSAAGLAFPRSSAVRLWSERWKQSEVWLEEIEERLRMEGGIVARGGGYDSWDLQVQGGILGRVQLQAAIEEHGGGKQLVRVRFWPRIWLPGLAIAPILIALSATAALSLVWLVCAVLALAATVPLLLAFRDCAAATAVIQKALEKAGFGMNR